MIKSNSRRELGRKRGLASARAWTPRAADADTIRSRALHDARGQIVREGCTYSASGKMRWRVVRSVRGRIDQFDIVAAESVWRTGGRRKVKRWISVKHNQK